MLVFAHVSTLEVAEQHGVFKLDQEVLHILQQTL